MMEMTERNNNVDRNGQHVSLGWSISLYIAIQRIAHRDSCIQHTHSNERASDQTNNQTTPSTSFAHPVEHPRTKLTNGKDGERKQISGLQNYYSYNFHKSGCRKNVCVFVCVQGREKKIH